MKLRNELYTDTWYCLSPHGSSLELTVTVLFPSQFLKAIFSIVLYIIITVKKFVKRLLFIFFRIFNSGYLRNVTEMEVTPRFEPGESGFCRPLPYHLAMSFCSLD